MFNQFRNLLRLFITNDIRDIFDHINMESRKANLKLLKENDPLREILMCSVTPKIIDIEPHDGTASTSTFTKIVVDDITLEFYIGFIISCKDYSSIEAWKKWATNITKYNWTIFAHEGNKFRIGFNVFKIDVSLDGNNAECVYSNKNETDHYVIDYNSNTYFKREGASVNTHHHMSKAEEYASVVNSLSYNDRRSYVINNPLIDVITMKLPKILQTNNHKIELYTKLINSYSSGLYVDDDLIFHHTQAISVDEPSLLVEHISDSMDISYVPTDALIERFTMFSNPTEVSKLMKIYQVTEEVEE